MASLVPIGILNHFIRYSQGFENIEFHWNQTDFDQLEQQKYFAVFLQNTCFVFRRF